MTSTIISRSVSRHTKHMLACSRCSSVFQICGAENRKQLKIETEYRLQIDKDKAPLFYKTLSTLKHQSFTNLSQHMFNIIICFRTIKNAIPQKVSLYSTLHICTQQFNFNMLRDNCLCTSK